MVQGCEAKQKWVADMTYLPTSSGWGYLAVVLELFSRKVVGWSMSNGLATEVITAAMRKSIQTRMPSAGTLLNHSDRACRYTSASPSDARLPFA
jgi:putative transposase